MIWNPTIMTYQQFHCTSITCLLFLTLLMTTQREVETSVKLVYYALLTLPATGDTLYPFSRKYHELVIDNVHTSRLASQTTPRN